MLGMYLAFWTFTLLHLDPYVTLVLSLPLLLGVGWLSYRIVMRPVIHRGHNVHVFTTVRLSIALQNVALVLWTADSHFVRTSYYAVVLRGAGAALNLAQLVAFAALALSSVIGWIAWRRRHPPASDEPVPARGEAGARSALRRAVRVRRLVRWHALAARGGGGHARMELRLRAGMAHRDRPLRLLARAAPRRVRARGGRWIRRAVAAPPGHRSGRSPARAVRTARPVVARRPSSASLPERRHPAGQRGRREPDWSPDRLRPACDAAARRARPRPVPARRTTGGSIRPGSDRHAPPGPSQPPPAKRQTGSAPR